METDQLIAEILNNDYLSGDHMNKFNDMLILSTTFEPQNVFFIGALEFVQPLPRDKKHFQLLSGNLTDVEAITHWICTYYDGNSVFIFDSLNRQILDNEQKQYLNRLFSHSPPIHYVSVQRQPNGRGCGLFAIGFAVSLLNSRNPAYEQYDHVRMRDHLSQIYRTENIQMFPSIHSYPSTGRLTRPKLNGRTFQPAIDSLEGTKRPKHLTLPPPPMKCSEPPQL